MESVTLITFCFGIFGLFALSEVIKLKLNVFIYVELWTFVKAKA